MSRQKKDPHSRMASYQEKYRELTAALAKTGFIWPGYIQRRWIKCGKPTCACRRDPKALHGPYIYWTSKQSKKTVSKLLSPKEAELLEQWIRNRRNMEKTIRKMKSLSRKAYTVALKTYSNKNKAH